MLSLPDFQSPDFWLMFLSVDPFLSIMSCLWCHEKEESMCSCVSLRVLLYFCYPFSSSFTSTFRDFNLFFISFFFLHPLLTIESSSQFILKSCLNLVHAFGKRMHCPCVRLMMIVEKRGLQVTAVQSGKRNNVRKLTDWMNWRREKERTWSNSWT